MQLKPSDILALCGFLLGAFIALKKPKKFIGWFVAGATGVYLLFALASPKEESKSGDKNSVTATASGNGQAQAAGHDIVNGVSETSLQQVLNLKEVELSEKILSEFPYGCVILGMSNGKVVYDARFKDGVRVNADWDNSTIKIEGQTAFIHIPKISWQFTNQGSQGLNITINDQWLFTEGVAQQNRMLHTYPATLYYEVMDAGRGIFLIGFKPY